MNNLLIILLLIIGCEGLAEELIEASEKNYDHCDLYTQYSEECEQIITECEEQNGIYSVNDNDENADWSDNDGCCCILPEEN